MAPPKGHPGSLTPLRRRLASRSEAPKSGGFGRWELEAALWLTPGVLVGFFASMKAASWLDRGRTRRAVLWTAGLAGALLIAVGVAR